MSSAPSSPEPPTPDRPLVVGLLGGIASGKSAVAELFAARGLERIDADAVAREIVAEPAIAARIRDRFGADVFGADGGLDRPALAARIFRDPDARRALDAITHPRISERIRALLETARAAGRPVLLDVPLLLEGGLIDCCDACVFVDAPIAVRRQRAAARGWAAGELERREAAQAPLADKRRRCRFAIDNGGELAHTAAAVDAVLAALRASR